MGYVSRHDVDGFKMKFGHWPALVRLMVLSSQWLRSVAYEDFTAPGILEWSSEHDANRTRCFGHPDEIHSKVKEKMLPRHQRVIGW